MSDAYRQSALLLHGLSDIDRQWILAQLTEEQRLRLQTQMTELAQLGMPADKSLVEGLLRQGRQKSTADADGPGAALRAASAEKVLYLLAREPAWLIAAVLAIEAWPWREAIYVGLDASKRERVKQALGDKPPVKLEQALLRQLESRLAEAAGEMPDSPATPTAWATIKQKIFRRAGA